MNLGEIRTAIDEIDRGIVSLIARRQEFVRLAGAQKANEAAVRAPDRVEQVVARVRQIGQESGADPDVVEATYRAMIGAFIEMEMTQLRTETPPL